MGGDLADVGESLVTGLAFGYLGGLAGGFFESVSAFGIQAAIRAAGAAGLLQGLYLIASDEPC